MKVIEPYFVIEDAINGYDILRKLELYGRVCYKSENKIKTIDSAEKFLRNAIKRGHLSLIEHEKVTVRIICDRGVTHEIVRHRIASYSQESTRYCDYTGEMVFIRPFFFEEDVKYETWYIAMENAENSYRRLRKLGASPQEARSVLPNSLKTEIVVTYNLREWRHFFNLRCSKGAHPQMRQIVIPILKEFQKQIPVIFEDFVIDQENLCLKQT